MSEDNNTQVDEAEKDLAAEVEKWKSLSRANERRAKENAEKAQRFDELESQNASLTAAVAAAEARASAAESTIAERDAEAERSKLLAEVAESKGLADPSVLVGDTREALEAHADRIKALIPEIPKAPGAGVQGDLGSDITPKSEDLSPNDLLRAAFKDA